MEQSGGSLPAEGAEALGALVPFGRFGLAGARAERVESPEGAALGPVAGGWLLQRVERTRPWQLLPPGARGSLVTASLVSLAGAATGLMTISHYPQLFIWFYVSSVLPLLCAPMLAERRLRRLAERSPYSVSLAGRRRGDVVKVRGRVRSGPTFESAGLRQPVVLACYAGTITYVTGHITDGLSRPWCETRGSDFAVNLESGESVSVRVRGAYFLPQPPEIRRLFWGRNMQSLPTSLRRLARVDGRGVVTQTIFGENNLAPGDEVEVVGVLNHEVRPEGAAGSRGARLLPALRAGGHTPLLVRRVDEPAKR